VSGGVADAPFRADLAEGPAGGRAEWLRTADGVRIRIALWPAGQKGTVLLFPGRTEHAEKYGRAAADLAARGYGCVAIDWRGQGMADHVPADPMVGHVQDFAEYQRDLDAVMARLSALDLPRPLYLVAHSMGGCIGLRALMRGLPVRAAAFSAPMWGIHMAAWMRPVAQVLAQMSVWTRQAHRYAPTTGGQSYLLANPFQGNVLTTDPDMWAYMRRQVQEEPAFRLGGPSMAWLRAALAECDALMRAPSPDLPAICALGTAEKVVDVAPIHLRMARWPKGRLDLYPAAEHEVMMETPALRGRFFDDAAALFAANP
jgi:lysophospholipase